MSFRLDPRDESDLRYYLGEDARGDVGVHSGSSSLEGRAIYEPIKNNRPFRYIEKDDNGNWFAHGTEDVGLRCGPILVKPKKPAYQEREMGHTLVLVTETEQRVEAVWSRLEQSHREALERCYTTHRFLPHFGVFGDIAPLILDTRGALTVESRERSRAKDDQLSRIECAIAFAARFEMGKEPASESDQRLRAEMQEEADERLSKACRRYTAYADEAREAKANQEGSTKCPT
jgi:hypothetical protein